jgi:hypothetical protein
MSPARMNWRRARLHSKPCLDHRYEFSEFRHRDRADRWLAAVERRLREQQRTTLMSSTAVRP